MAAAPDETTILRFRHPLELYELCGKLCGKMLDTMNLYLDSTGIRIIGTETIVDATIVNAPSSTENATGERDPEMRQTRKGSSGTSEPRRISAWIAKRSWCIR
jgi:transposase, IS5 family